MSFKAFQVQLFLAFDRGVARRHIKQRDSRRRYGSKNEFKTSEREFLIIVRRHGSEKNSFFFVLMTSSSSLENILDGDVYGEREGGGRLFTHVNMMSSLARSDDKEVLLTIK